jgi:diguanylate cyclase
MQFEQTRESIQTAKSVLDQIVSHAYPANPKTYEVLYRHETGEPAALTFAVDSILRSKQKLEQTDIETICNEFCSQGGFVERSSEIGDLLSFELRRVQSAFELAEIEAADRSNALSRATANYQGRDHLRELVRLLILTAHNMEQSKQRLERQLSSSIVEIKRLKARLEVARADSLLDPLTSLQNRVSFDQSLAQVMKSAKQSNAPVSLLMIDIDHFKGINDQYGHLIGDQIIKLVAEVARNATDHDSHLARFGGEEFLVLLNCNMEAAFDVAERIRRQINQGEYRLVKTGEVIGHVSVSIGISSLRRSDTALSFLERADQSLYAAKTQGRNRVSYESNS